MDQLPDRKTKIVCTIGPASQSGPVLTEMIAAGMSVARINFSHGDLDSHRHTIRLLRAAAEASGRRVAIMGDLPGPKMRIGVLAAEPVELVRDQPFILQPGDFIGSAARAAMSFADLPHVVKPGDMIYINDGFIQLEVEQVLGDAVHCRVRVGGELRSRKGVNFPGIDLGISAFTDRDRELLGFAAAEGLDAVSQSFVQDAQDIAAVRDAAAAIGYHPLVIAKIERSRALDNIEGILAAADGIMVARGDLGVEVPFEQVAIIQKSLIRQASQAGKPVITATHMLESMIGNRRPTRAEVTDVANAILDGSDCVMLSGETSIGSFPIDSVAAMAAIASYAEEHRPAVPPSSPPAFSKRQELDASVPVSMYLASETLQPDIVFVPSRTGDTARRLARFRLPIWIVALCHTEKACQDLQFSYGIFPVLAPSPGPSWGRFVTTWLHENAVPAERVLLTEISATLRERDTTSIEIIDLRPPLSLPG